MKRAGSADHAPERRGPALRCVSFEFPQLMRNYFLISSAVAFTLVAGCGKTETSGEPKPTGGKQITVALMPKSKGNAYFISCRKGAEEAAKDLGVKLLWDGPTEPDPAKQNEIVET